MASIKASFGIALCVMTLAAVPACSKPSAEGDAAETVEAPEAAAAKPAADSIDTLSGAKFADYAGDAAAGEKAFIACKTCHVVEAGVNRIGPSLHAIVGHPAGTVAGFKYSAANKDSGIVWSEAKLFQYLEAPQRVMPGTIMTYAGMKDPQARANLIAYLKTKS